MAPIKLEFAQLHNPIFLAGKNLGDKLQPLITQGLKISYDRKEKELLVEYTPSNGVARMAIVPSTNIVSMVQSLALEQIEVIPVKPNIMKKITAQVESPMSHVFEGPGAGKS